MISLLNSKTINWYFKQISSKLGDGGIRFKKTYMEQIPISETSKEQQKQLIDLAKTIMDLNKNLSKEIKSFHKYLKSDFNVSKINKKLTKYYNLTFDDLYKEVKKQYKQINRHEKDKLEQEYTLSMRIITPLQKEIKNIDKKIDKLVYDLYELTPDEIKIIEKIKS